MARSAQESRDAGAGSRGRRLAAAAAAVYLLLAALAAAVMASPAAAPPSAAGTSGAAEEDGPGAVGLEAQGVDPWLAWSSGGRLDVRDALNRPVSAAKIGRQVKAGWSEAVADAAFASRLPMAASVLKALERIGDLSACLQEEAGGTRGNPADALPFKQKPSGGSQSELRPAPWKTALSGLLFRPAETKPVPSDTSLPLILRC